MPNISPQREALLALSMTARKRGLIRPLNDGVSLELQGHPRAVLLGLRHDVGKETIVLVGHGKRVCTEISGPCIFVHLRRATDAECGKMRASSLDAAELLRLEGDRLVPTGVTEVFARLA